MANGNHFINTSELAMYMEVSLPTARKKYKKYLLEVNKRDFQQLTVFDIAKVDCVPVKLVINKLERKIDI